MSKEIRWPDCIQCKSPRVHRHKRSAMERLFSYIVPMRPLRCSSCKTVQWRRMPFRAGPLNYFTSLLIWVGLSYFVFDTSHHQAPEHFSEALRAEEAVQDQPDAITPDRSEPAPSPNVEPESAGRSLAQPAPALTLAAHLLGTLSTVEVRHDGETATVTLAADRPIEQFTLKRSKAAGGFVLDIAGKWKLADSVQRVRKMQLGNLREISIGEHPEHLRVVFRLHDMDTQRPKLNPAGGALNIIVQ